MTSHTILGVNLHPTSYAEATQHILHWSNERQGRMVCAANVHMIMEAHDDPAFKAILNEADLVTPDGMPLVWILRRLGFKDQTRVYGPDLMLHVLGAAEAAGTPVGFYGGTPEVLEALQVKLRSRFPALQIAYAFSPPFWELSETEKAEQIHAIRAADPRILFVGLGCPKQERWMAQHRHELPMVTLGVGAAFDLHAGSLRQAPPWMQRIGLEWLFRLMVEPRRLWKRYLVHNPRFIWLIFLQLMGWRHFNDCRD